MTDRNAPFGCITLLLAITLAALVAAGCGSPSSAASTDTRHADEAARGPFDASFVPGDATWLLVLRLDDARIDRLRRAGERVAGWPLVEAFVPTRRESIDALMGRLGLASTGDSSIAWIGLEAGAAILPGDDAGWIVWADVRDGQHAKARAAAADILRRSSRSVDAQVEERDGRILIASSPEVLDRVHAAQAGRDAYSDRREWTSLSAERARSTSIAAFFGREGGGILGADSHGIRYTGNSTNHRCENYPAGDAFAELAKRSPGPAIQRASSDGPAADARRLIVDRAFTRAIVSQLLVDSRAETNKGLRSGIRGVQQLIDALDLAKPAPPSGIQMLDDPAYASALASLGTVPDDAGVVYWIDAGRLARTLVAELRAQHRLGRTEAAIASGVADGIDGALIWVHTSGTQHCMSNIGLRVSIPSD